VSNGNTGPVCAWATTASCEALYGSGDESGVVRDIAVGIAGGIFPS
jgi:hypothetical protein